MELENKLNLIKFRIETLLNRNIQLINENKSLTEEIGLLKYEVEENKKIIKDYENKSLNLHFNNSIENEEKNKLKFVIDDLINEIDKGIELLKS